MKECMIMNIGCMAAGSIPIAVGCYVTKSALPLFAFLLIPKWNYNHTDGDQEGKE